MNWTQLLSSARPGQSQPSQAASRSAFEQDFDRIIFSHPFRRLQDKTQVHPLPEHDFVHTRLTHSLEVSSVGRSLGRNVGEQIIKRHPELNEAFTHFDFGAVVAAASLAHDLGNPPFGHAGEDALSDYFIHRPELRQQVTDAEWHDLVRFEGNAQGYRIVHQKDYGFRLTLATLGAFTKYPCPAQLASRDPRRKSQKKYGYFQSEKALFTEMASGLGLRPLSSDTWQRHPLAFLVEAADDICYSIIDLEDGCRLGLVSFEETLQLLSPILKEKLDVSKLGSDKSLNARLGTLRAMTINALVANCTSTFLDNEQAILNGEFDSAIMDLGPDKEALKQIASLSVQRIYRAPQVVEIEAAGHEVLPGLIEEFMQVSHALRDGQPSRKYSNLSLMLPPEIRLGITRAESPYAAWRIVVDFVSGLTDRYALSLYRKIKGISLN